MNTKLTKLAKDLWRLDSANVSVEISRETTDPREWIVAVWGAADIEGIFPTLSAAVTAALSIACKAEVTA